MPLFLYQFLKCLLAGAITGNVSAFNSRTFQPIEPGVKLDPWRLTETVDVLLTSIGTIVDARPSSEGNTVMKQVRVGWQRDAVVQPRNSLDTNRLRALQAIPGQTGGKCETPLSEAMAVHI